MDTWDPSRGYDLTQVEEAKVNPHRVVLFLSAKKLPPYPLDIVRPTAQSQSGQPIH